MILSQHVAVPSDSIKVFFFGLLSVSDMTSVSADTEPVVIISS